METVAPMSLKVELKPGEKLLIGNCVVTNSDQRARLFIDGRAPILREKDILTAESANTPAKRIYLAVQLMYINEDVAGLSKDYFELVGDIVRAAPRQSPLLTKLTTPY
jgi:flagellar biosynthesis repressor protein FlbT